MLNLLCLKSKIIKRVRRKEAYQYRRLRACRRSKDAPDSLYISGFSRALTAAVAICGLSLFVCDAFLIVTERAPFTAVLYPSLIFSVLVGAMCLNYYALYRRDCFDWRWIYGMGRQRIQSICLIISPRQSHRFHNAAIERIAYAGSVGIKRYALPENFAAAYDKTSLYNMSVAIFTLIMAIIFVPAIIKRVRMKYIIIMGALIVTPIFLYNVMQDNWGFSLLLAGLSGVIVLWLYDRRYTMPSKRKMIIYELSRAFTCNSRFST